MWGWIAIAAVILFFIYWLMKKPKEEDGYGEYANQSSSGLLGKVKDACCTRIIH